MRYRGAETEVLHDRYAHALIDIAEANGKLDKVADELSILNKLAGEDEEFVKVFNHPEIDRGEKLKLLDDIAKRAQFSDEFCGFLRLLVQRNRFSLIHGIFLRYSDLYGIKKRRIKVSVRTAASLDREQLSRLAKILTDWLKKEVVIEEFVEPSLVGGFSLKVGDSVYNLSILDQLKLIRKKLIVTNKVEPRM